MSQGSIFASIDPNTTSGTQLATILNDFKDAVVAGFCTNGGTRPANLAAGGYWIDQQNDPVWAYNMYDGTDDITIFSVNTTTNSVSFGSAGDSLEILKSSDDSLGAILNLVKERASGSQTQDGDTIGEVNFTGTTADPVQEIMAQVKVVSTDVVTNSAHGSYMTISNTPDAGATLTERIRIQENGKVGFGTTTADKRIHVKGTSTTGDIENEIAEDSTVGPTYFLNKKRIALSGQVLSGDTIGNIDFISTDQNGDDRTLGKIQVNTTETTQSSQHGSEVVVQTVIDGTTALADRLKINNLGNVEVPGNLTVTGDFTVDGTTTTVNTGVLDVEDANITINKNGTQATADAQDSGFTVEMSDATNAGIGYDSTLTSKFKVGEIGSEIEVADVSSSQSMSNKTATTYSIVAPSRLDVKQDTFANLTTYAGSAADGQVCFATDNGNYYGIKDNALVDLGGGGAGGDANNIHLILAGDLNDVTDVDLTGNNAEFDGGGIITASSLTLSTITTDLIKSSKVVKYDPNADGSGDYFGFTKSIPRGLRGRSLGFLFEYRTDSTTVDDDFRFSFKQKDGTDIGNVEYFNLPAASNTDGNSKLYIDASFIASDCTEIEFGIQNQSTTTTVEFYIDNISINAKPFTSTNINQMTGWTDYTPTTSGLGTISVGSVRYRRVGDTLHLQARFDTGTAAASEAQFGLPGSLTVKSGLSLESVGWAQRGGSSADFSHFSVLATGGDSFVNFGARNDSINNIDTAQNGNAIFGSTETEYINAFIPIEGWQSTVEHVITPKKVNKSYSEAGGDFTITGTNWTTGNATAFPYVTSEGTWRVKFNIEGSVSVATAALTLTFSGISLTFIQPFSVASFGTFAPNGRSGGAGTSTLTIDNTAAISNFYISGDVELQNKPTWADNVGTNFLAAVPVTKTVTLQEEQTQNSNGSSSSISYATMVLNNSYDDTEIVNLSANEFTLYPGRHVIKWISPGYSNQVNNLDGHQSRLYNVTDAVEVRLGSTGFSRTTSGGEIEKSESKGQAVVVLTEQKTFRIERIATNAITGGFGTGANLDTEVYGQVFIDKHTFE